MAEKKEELQIEMTQAELATKVNKLIKSLNDDGYNPLMALFILRAAQQHVEQTHGVYINEITFEKVDIQ